MKSFQDRRVVIIPITEEDFRNATRYVDHKGCPLYKAICRIFQPKTVIVTAWMVNIDGERYHICDSDHNAYAGITIFDVGFLIRIAKKYIKLKPIIVHLIPIE